MKPVFGTLRQMHRQITLTLRITIPPDAVKIYYIGVVQTWETVMKRDYLCNTQIND